MTEAMWTATVHPGGRNDFIWVLADRTGLKRQVDAAIRRYRLVYGEDLGELLILMPSPGAVEALVSGRMPMDARYPFDRPDGLRAVGQYRGCNLLVSP